ncbi:GntR family transcriptional regulator [Nocardioides sp. SYSU D00065]|uniref:GntR family transcriptional regulator n=1 Tax=Nocardioides sp. SYSU D00065 TaxID=2817378 RepID=UPI001B33C7B4|nr:GntR family transcriptional regulator [Nocardioides sp. SYSU D00065]
MQEVRRETAVERVAASIRSEILGGVRAPGSAIREEQVADDLAVSRHTVRSAIGELRVEGLVETQRFRGARVVRFDFAQASDLQLVRTALEAEAVRILCERHGQAPWPPAVLDAAAGAVDALEATSSSDVVAVQSAHSRIHHAIVDAAGSPRLSRLHAQLSTEVQLLLSADRRQYSVAELVGQHRAYLASLPEQGPEAVRGHMQASLSRLYGDEAGADEPGGS